MIGATNAWRNVFFGLEMERENGIRLSENREEKMILLFQ